MDHVIGFNSTTAFAVLMQAVEGSVLAKVGYYVNSVLMMIMTVGFGGYQANVIQLAIDQLHDSSTAEIKSFITWYAWAAIGGGMLEHLAIPCIASSEENSNIFRLAIICICLSIALILNSFCSHWLVKEPIGQNPFKLVYKVIKYAIKTKHPRCRSAFTYCEDNFPSRIDFGKCKYGGPFTTEQVEDVKTFLQLLPVLLVGCTFGGEIVADNGIQWYQLRLLLTFPIDHFMLQDCYSEVYFTQAFYYSAVILIPLYEFALYPALYKCHLPLKLHWKFVMGVILQMAKLISLMLIQVAARYNYYIQQHVNSELNETHHVGCMFYESRGALSLSLSYKWTAIPQFLHSISMALIFISGLEFLCAQVPYSMKGLIFGTTYGFGAISTAIALLFSILFREKLFNWSTGVISCGFWYFFQVLVVIIVISIFASIILKWYKYRKREDVLPNEQIFAEQYYTREN